MVCKATKKTFKTQIVFYNISKCLPFYLNYMYFFQKLTYDIIIFNNQ